MEDYSPDYDPEWETEISIAFTPAVIIETIFPTAENVHTASDSCVDSDLVVVDIVAQDESSDNHCRFIEQRYTEDGSPDTTWHDWTVELRLEGIYITAHWRAQIPGSPADWKWSADEAQSAFTAAAVLVGRRVRSGIVVEESSAHALKPARTRH